jgi:hypothetical protein
MKFQPALKSAKASILAAITIATSIASNVAPSQAEQPDSIFTAAGKPQVLQFNREGYNRQNFTIGCQALRNLWSGIETKNIGIPIIYDGMASSPTVPLKHLDCNAPNLVQGYTSSAFGSKAGVIVTRGNPLYIKSTQFFTAMGITPKSLTEQQGQDFIAQNSRALNSSVVLEVGLPNLQPGPKPPNLPPVTFTNGNLIKNGNFSSGLSGWAVENSVAGVNRGTMRQNSGQLLQSFRINVGAKYRVSFDLITDGGVHTSMFLVSTFPLHSNVSFRLSDLIPTKVAENQYRYSFEITGADRRIGISEPSVIDTLNFRNVAQYATFSITNVSVVPIN